MFLYLSRKHALIDFNAQQRRATRSVTLRGFLQMLTVAWLGIKNRSMKLLQRASVFAPPGGFTVIRDIKEPINLLFSTSRAKLALSTKYTEKKFFAG